MDSPSLCMLHEAVGNQNAIAKVAMWGVRVALAAGWKVTVVTHDLDESLMGEVEWVPMYVPPRVYLLKWLTARHFMNRALAGRRFDVVHAHQPQAAWLADVFQCHFLTRVANERRCLEMRPGLRPTINRWQQQAAMLAEDHYYKHWNPDTRMLYVSKLVAEEFVRLYGTPADAEVLENACPPAIFPSETDRRQARLHLLGQDLDGIVIGFLGGVDERKGYRRLTASLRGASDIFLLMGGANCSGYHAGELAGHFKALGFVGDVEEFYAACDVFIVPSLFEPFGLVAFEAAAHGLPVIATLEVGALPHLLDYNAGVCWSDGADLPSLVRDVVRRKAEFQAGASNMANALSSNRQAEKLLAVYEDVLRRKQDAK